MDKFVDEFEVASREFIIWNPIHRKFQFLFPEVWRAKRASRELQAIAFNIMRAFRAKKKGREGTSNSYSDDTIISRIVNNENYLNDSERAADIVLFLVAGHDTTAFSIAWTLFEVANNKRDIQLERYREEAAVAESEEDLRRIDALHYIIKEGMRFHPVAAMGSLRNVPETLDFADDDGSRMRFPKDCVVWVNQYSMFRNPKYFGDDADVFRPDRWREASVEMQLAHIPFAAGARNCAGQSLANAEMSTVLSMLLAKYDFSVADPGDADYFLTLKPKGVRLVARKLK